MSRRPTTPATPTSEREVRRNHRYGVLNGALYQAGEGFMDAGTVIPVFLARLTHSSALVGLASAMSDLGWLAPQFLVSPYVARHAQQMPLYRTAATVRTFALVALAALVWLLYSQPFALLLAFFGCYSVYCMFGGLGALPFMEVVGRVVPRHRLGAFWAARLFWGGALAALTGLAVREILRLNEPRVAFGILFALAALVVSVGYACFMRIREPECPPGTPVGSPLDVLRDGLQQTRSHPVFRDLLTARSAAAAWLTLSPFMVLFSLRDLDGGPGVAGTFLVARVAGFVAANLVWPRLGARVGNGGIMRIALRVLILVCLAAAALAWASPWGLGWIAAPVAIVGLETLAFVGGAMQSGLWVAYGSLLIELAPAGRRQVFVAQMNTFVGVSMLLPALGGLLADRIHIPMVFALCAALAAWGAIAAARLPAHGHLEPEGLNEDCGCS